MYQYTQICECTIEFALNFLVMGYLSERSHAYLMTCHSLQPHKLTERPFCQLHCSFMNVLTNS